MAYYHGIMVQTGSNLEGMKMSQIRVILADDHPVVRAGIRNLLSHAPEIDVVAETGSGVEVIRLTNELNPDVLLLDMEMPGLDGVDVTRRLRAANSPVRILALSGYDDKQYIMNLLEQGVAGYIMKDEAARVLVQAVKGVALGQTGWFSQRVAEQIPHWMAEDQEDPNKLTPREADVLHLLAEHKSDAMIGLTLGMSEKTIQATIQSIQKKLHAATREEAVRNAKKRGLG